MPKLSVDLAVRSRLRYITKPSLAVLCDGLDVGQFHWEVYAQTCPIDVLGVLPSRD
jgi:hypothetical protein